MLAAQPGWSELQAVRKGRVYLADGNQYFNRPGPRIVDTVEILAEMLHPKPFDFGHPGWSSERHSVFLVAPVQDTLVAEVLAWTPSTKGTVRTTVVHISAPEQDQPTADELEAHLGRYAQQVRGRIVLNGAPASVAVFHWRYLSPKYATTRSAQRKRTRVRSVLTRAPMRSR